MTTDSLFSKETVACVARELNAPSLHVDVRRSWSAGSKTYRSLIREALSDDLCEDLMSLTSWPMPTRHTVTISHCRTAGGYARVDKPAFIGFDLEMLKRVTEPIAERLSLPGELGRAASPAHLWAAKEAAFKAFSHAGLASILPDVTIGSWKRLSGFPLHDAFVFTVLKPTNPSGVSNLKTSARGLAFVEGDVIAGFFVIG